MPSFYGHTNESLWSIVKGLELSTQDSVLCINGSGDQTFAIAEFAESITSVDTNPEQLNYAKKRVNALLKKEYDDFFPLIDNSRFPLILDQQFHFGKEVDMQTKLMYLQFMCAIMSTEFPHLATWSGSIRYFLGEDNPFSIPPYSSSWDYSRLERIRENVDAISFFEGDIISYFQENAPFSKVYISNALLCSPQNSSMHSFAQLFDNLPKDCLVYSTEITKNSLITLAPSWSIDERLTTHSQELELPHSWIPKVYRKIK